VGKIRYKRERMGKKLERISKNGEKWVKIRKIE